MRTDHRDVDGDDRPVTPHLAHGVPGGSARLPRLGRPIPDEHVVLDRDGKAPPVEVVDGGFLHDEVTRARRSREARESQADHAEDGPVHLSFADYSPTESLFVHRRPTGSTEEPTTDRVTVISVSDDDPTVILGVEPDADWNTIRAAHRKLLAKLHPDRFVTADERTQADAAERLAAINVAYHELEKVRRAV